MKKTALLTLISAAVLLAAGFGQAPPAGRKFATLGPNESIVSEETCLLAGGPGCLDDDFFVVTQARVDGTYVFFTYDKSGRKGPFAKIEDSMLKQGFTDVEPHQFNLENDMSSEGFAEIPDPANSRLHFIQFGGKTFGPFKKSEDFGEVWFLADTPDKTTLCWISILPNRDVVGYSRGL